MKDYLREFYRVLKPEGLLVFQVPITSLLNTHNPFHQLPVYHPFRILNKVRWELKQLSLRLFGDSNTRFYLFKRLRLSARWLYEQCKLQPAVAMHHLEESEILTLMAELGAEIVHVVKDTHQEPGMLNGQFIVMKPAQAVE
jgi:ubiquinone/menaquinone biosynthesis C-methylase UbiE